MAPSQDHRVSLVQCADYAPERVDAAVRQAVALLGGMERFVRPGDRVLLKPNLVRPLPPDRAATTHPTVVAAVARLVIEAGGQALIADSPGGPYSVGLLRTLYRRTGMEKAAAESGASLNEDTTSGQISHPEGEVLRRIDLIQPAIDADVIINLPKLKTHNLTGLTLCVKNLFGLVPGTLKFGYHAKLRETLPFCEGLLDILTATRPTLHLMDGIIGMEGNGPSGGQPRALGMIVAGADGNSVDICCSALVGYEPLSIPTIHAAVQRGLTSGRVEDLEVLGDDPSLLRVTIKQGTAAAIDPGILPRPLARLLSMPATDNGNGEATAERLSLFKVVSSGWLARQLVVVPYASPRCIGCGYCAKHCPVDAITMVHRRPQMDYTRCIRCYCCHELCPELAIDLRRPLLGRVLLGR